MKHYLLERNLRNAPAVTGKLGWPKHGGRALPGGLTLAEPVALRTLRPQLRDRVVAQIEAAVDASDNRAVEPDSIVAVRARAISAVFVPGHCMDHSDPRPLQDAVTRKLFELRAVYENHWTSPSRAHGFISEGTWDDTKLGAAQAPGVNVLVAIDGSLNQDARTVARGVSVGYLSRWSLGFQADYVASHPDEMDTWDEYLWWKKLGEKADDGEIYRLICTEIVDVFELSAVDVGAIESARTLEGETSLRADSAPPTPKTKPALPALLALPLRPRSTETQR